VSHNIKIITLLFFFFLQVNLFANVNGIKLEIVEASKYGTVHIPLVNKRMNIDTDMFRLGYMQAGKSTTKLLHDNSYYVITLKDKYSKAPLHIIAKGSYMKRRPYNAGALTEIVFMLSKDLLGKNYNKDTLEHRLNKIAKKIIKRKGFVLDNKFDIDYTDILLYKNGSHVVYRPYDPYVLTLEKKIKENSLSYQEAYRFVYDKTATKITEKKKIKDKDGIKKVKPLYRVLVFKHIAKNSEIGTEVTTLEQLRIGSAKVDSFEILESSIPFRIDNDGVLTLSSQLTQSSYTFHAVAHTEHGDSNTIEFTMIVDPIKGDTFYKLTK